MHASAKALSTNHMMAAFMLCRGSGAIRIVRQPVVTEPLGAGEQRQQRHRDTVVRLEGLLLAI